MTALPGRLFAYRLAERLGYANVDAMLREMTSTQLEEWEAYYQLAPWGYEVESLRAGVVCSTIANFAGKVLADGRRTTPEDFLQISRRPKRAKTPQELSAEIMSSFQTLVA